MNNFTTHTGIAVPLIRNNVDTDAIIPSSEMKAVSKEGLAEGLFAAWRYLDVKSRTKDPEFALNNPNYKDASIILSGRNFGCGSSREHAVWALKEYGIRCIIAESFGAIFNRNCVANGILPISLDKSLIDKLANQSTPQLTIDLELQLLRCNEFSCHFDIAPNDKHSLIHGIDPIASTLERKILIDDFVRADKIKRPWVYKEIP
jgi:3-isopropylmalate/(R)-2-methylmalate dehydratase small subunit